MTDSNMELVNKAEALCFAYFDDMTLNATIDNNCIVSKFLQKHVDVEDQFDSAPPICINTFTFTIGELPDGVYGTCNATNKVVTISPQYIDDDNVLLHEMIHAFEQLIDECFAYSQYHDVVLLCLYNDLRAKISDLDERIVQFARLYKGIDTTEQGGRHDILFLLKSFDLDLILNLPLGSICGYGAEEFGMMPSDEMA